MEAEAGGATRGGVGQTMTNQNILSANRQTNLFPSRRVSLHSSATQLATIHFRLSRDFRKDGTGGLRQGQWKMKRGRQGRSPGPQAGPLIRAPRQHTGMEHQGLGSSDAVATAPSFVQKSSLRWAELPALG